MKKRLTLMLMLIAFGFTLITSIEATVDVKYDVATNYNQTYTFDVEHGTYRFTHTLYVSVSPSLYDFYRNNNHKISRESDYAKFVTPDAVRKIAENLRQAVINSSNSDEDFVNDVLSMVHQIPYSVSACKYPVETIVNNSGDCDVLSFLAASIMKAGGMDVVLLIYRDLPGSHMNVGVNLPHKPQGAAPEIEPVSYEYNNKTYWVAECTPPGDWKLGQQPAPFGKVEPTVISLDNCEESSPALVSSSIGNPLIASSISITPSLESSNTEKESPLTISGTISPASSSKKVVMYVRQDFSVGEVFETETDDFGNYALTWNVTPNGKYYIQTSLVPFSNYAGSDSDLMTFFAGSYPPRVGGTGPYGEWNPDVTGYNTFSSKNDKNFLKSDLEGANISLSGEFIILNKEQLVTNSIQTLTVPEKMQTIRFGRGQRLMLTVPEHTVTIQESALANNHFGFILQNSNGNYSANVRLLNGSDVFQMEKQFDENTLAFMNASTSIKENIWHKAVVKVTGGEITAELRSEQGDLLDEFAVNGEKIGGNESGILISCNLDTFMAFKNLKVENLDPPPKPIGDSNPPESSFELPALFTMFLILLGLVGAVTTFLRKGKKASKA